MQQRFAKIGLIAVALMMIPNITLAAVSPIPSAATSAKAKVKSQAQAKLVEAKLKVCQSKEAALMQRSTQLTKMTTNMEETFTKIADRVKAHYTTTVVPSGKTVSNYDVLVAAIATKQTAVKTALTTAQSSAEAISCSSDDPKGQLTQFRTDMQAVKSALKDYRTAIKDLIVAIRTVTGKTEASVKPTPSVSSTVSPTVSPAAKTTPEVE